MCSTLTSVERCTRTKLDGSRRSFELSQRPPEREAAAAGVDLHAPCGSLDELDVAHRQHDDPAALGEQQPRAPGSVRAHRPGWLDQRLGTTDGTRKALIVDGLEQVVDRAGGKGLHGAIGVGRHEDDVRMNAASASRRTSSKPSSPGMQMSSSMSCGACSPGNRGPGGRGESPRSPRSADPRAAASPPACSASGSSSTTTVAMAALTRGPGMRRRCAAAPLLAHGSPSRARKC